MTIEPEAKDWTWVLARPCPECGFATADVDPASLGALIRANGASFTVDSFARYFLHDVVHHLDDVRPTGESGRSTPDALDSHDGWPQIAASGRPVTDDDIRDVRQQAHLRPVDDRDGRAAAADPVQVDAGVRLRDHRDPVHVAAALGDRPRRPARRGDDEGV